MAATWSAHSQTSAHEEQIKQELKTLQLEFSWLLDTEFVVKLEAIQRCLEECFKIFSSVLKGSDSHNIYLSHPQSDNVTCVASVDGDKISKADITFVRLSSKYGSNKLRTSIKEHAAWRLEQIQDCANHFQIARQQLQNILDTRSTLKSPDQLSRVFSELSGHLRKAEEVLVVPRLPSMSEIYSAEQRSRFKPELPEDTVVHFHISSFQLVLTIFTVTQTTKSSNKGVSSDSSFQVGTTFEHGGSTYEVAHQMQVLSPVPWLSVVLSSLKEAQEVTQDFIDKVNIFNAMLPSS